MTHEQKRIDDLLNLMAILNSSIMNEIREINCGRGHSALDIRNTLDYWIDDRTRLMRQEEMNND